MDAGFLSRQLSDALAVVILAVRSEASSLTQTTMRLRFILQTIWQVKRSQAAETFQRLQFAVDVQIFFEYVEIIVAACFAVDVRRWSTEFHFVAAYPAFQSPQIASIVLNLFEKVHLRVAAVACERADDAVYLLFFLLFFFGNSDGIGAEHSWIYGIRIVFGILAIVTVVDPVFEFIQSTRIRTSFTTRTTGFTNIILNEVILNINIVEVIVKKSVNFQRNPKCFPAI